MPENWNIPQEIRLGGCIPAETSLTIRAKANLESGFKGTEKDELTVLISQLKNCGNDPKDSLARLKHEPSQSNSFRESSLIEFESPFFMILRAFLQPFFFALGMANTLHNIISPKHQKQDAITQSVQTHDAENEFGPNTFIDNDPLTTISNPIIGEEPSPINGIIETILLGPDPVNSY